MNARRGVRWFLFFLRGRQVMSELRTRLDNDMLLRGMADRTRESYVAAVARMVKFYRRSPEQVSAPEVQAYLLHMLQEEKLSWSTCNIAAHALRFLYHTTLGRDRTQLCIPAAKQPSRVAQILSQEEIVRLFDATPNPK